MTLDHLIVQQRDQINSNQGVKYIVEEFLLKLYFFLWELSNQGGFEKVMTSQNGEPHNLTILGLLLGNLERKHLM
jgi:hypothetical protein